jgi:hypothetical protein
MKKENPRELLQKAQTQLFGILRNHRVKLDESYNLQVSLSCLGDLLKEGDSLNGYVKYLQDYIQGIISEDYDAEDYLSFDKWLQNN